MAKSSISRVWVSVLTAAVFAASLVATTAFTPSAGAVPPKADATSGVSAQEMVGNCAEGVVLDPGHGGTDYRAINGALKEKEQNLEVPNRLKPLLEGAGYPVCMTRTDNDTTLSNNDRYTYANATGAKILVSIHMNASSDPKVDYTTTLYGKWRKDKELAWDVFDGLRFNLPAASGSGYIAARTPYSYASGVLLKSDMPATIAETVFITNTDEAQLLSAGTRQQQIADALKVGIMEYLKTH